MFPRIGGHHETVFPVPIRDRRGIGRDRGVLAHAELRSHTVERKILRHNNLQRIIEDGSRQGCLPLNQAE